MTKLVQVDSPGDLPAGYVFDATVDGKTFSVTVPEGGVKQGQMIEVPYPEGAMSSVDISSGNAESAPTGRWRNGLCDCCETVATGRFWMGWCLNCVLQGQLLERYRLNLFGMPGAGQKHVCIIYSLTMVVLYIIFFATTRIPALYTIMLIVFTVWHVVTGTCTRFTLRQKYQIPGSTFGDGCLDDCCCTFWCGCCTTIQQSRHSHDEKVHGYDCCSKTGLRPDAPAIV